jgi:hypothetical protein
MLTKSVQKDPQLFFSRERTDLHECTNDMRMEHTDIYEYTDKIY